MRPHEFFDHTGNRLVLRNPGQVVIQAIGVGTTWVFSLVGTLIILMVLDVTIGLRVTKEEKVIGLNISQHSERAYG